MQTENLIYALIALAMLPLIGNVLAMARGVLVATRQRRNAARGTEHGPSRLETHLRESAAALGCDLEGDDATTVRRADRDEAASADREGELLAR